MMRRIVVTWIASIVFASAVAGRGWAAPARLSAGPERVPLAERSTYERYVTLDDLLDVAPDSSRALAEAWRRTRPGDVASAYGLAWGELRRDSAQTAAAFAHAERDSSDRDAVALAAALRLATRRPVEGRAGFERLSRLHARHADWSGAAWALILRVVRDVASPEPDLVERQASELVARSANARERAEVLLLLADRSGPLTPTANAERLRAALAAGGAASQAARGEAQRRLGSALRANGRHDEAETAYRASAALADSCGWLRLSLRAWRGVATITRARGRVAESASLTRRLADQARESGYDEQYAEALQDLGNSYLSLGRLREARAVLEERLELIRVHRWHADQRMMTLDQLGGVSALEGRVDEAREQLEEALELSRRRRGHPFEPTALLHLANLHRDMGDDTRALELLADGLTAANAVGSRRTESMMIALKADILFDQGKLAESAALAGEAARHARAHEPRNLPMAWRTQSHALVAVGRLAEAQGALDSLRAFLAQLPDTIQQSRLERAEAELALARGDTVRALAKSALALDLARAMDTPDEVASASLSYGLALQSAGRVAESAPLLEMGIAYPEAQIASTSSGDERSRTRRRWLDYYGDLARAYQAGGWTADAFALLERSRARELRAQFGEAAAGASSHLSEALATELREQEADLAAVQLLLLEEWAKPVRSRDQALPQMEARADSLKRSWAELQVRVQRAAPEFARAAGIAPPMSLSEVQARLEPHETLVAFMNGWQRLLRFDVTRTRCLVHEVPGDGERTKARIRAWVEACQQGSNESWRKGAAELADTLLAGLTLPAGDVATLLIVPDGLLHTMPFEALLVRDGGRRVPLLERAAIVVAEAPGLFFVPAMPPRAAGGQGIVAFGDPMLASAGEAGRERSATLSPLPFARHEVERLKEAFPEARVYLGGEATEPRVHEELQRARIVHVAAHGFYDDRFPRFSSLALARGGNAGEATDDGLLQAWEVLAHRGTLELVTLSACETGRGRVVGGEGLDGLSRAFRIAGARQLIASLWRVDDAATASLMGDFYRRLARGESVSAAFRQARLTLARGGGASSGAARGIGRTTERSVAAHPKVWAAFVLRGAR